MTVTVAPTVELGNEPPRVRLDVTGNAGETAATITRLDPDGRTRTVRTFDGNPLSLSTGAGLIYDYEAPFGSPVTFSTVESPGIVSAAVAVNSTRVWLIHVGVPELSTPVTVASLGPRTYAARRGVFYPMGRATPVVQTDGSRKSAEWTLSVYTATLEERAAIEDLCSDAGVLLLNVPADKGWGVNAEYVAVGDLTENRVSRFAGEPSRTWELPLTVVDAPAGGSQSERTYVDVLVDNATYADLMTRYPSYLALLAGP